MADLNVLHVTAHAARRMGGAAAAAAAMCSALARQGVSTTRFATDLDGLGSWLPRRSHVLAEADQFLAAEGVDTRLFQTSWPTHFAYSPSMARELQRRVAEFDVVHIHQINFFTTAAAAYFCRRYRIPYIIQPHGALDHFHLHQKQLRKFIYNLLVERRNLDSAGFVQFTSQGEMQQAASFGIRAPSVVLPLGLDLRPFDRLPAPGAFRARNPEIGLGQLVTFIGRLTPKKGLDLLIPAMRQILTTIPTAHLIIAGPDNEGYGRVLRTLVAQHQLGGHVSFTGMLNLAEVIDLLVESSAWVLPSYRENFGVAVLEAMACGAPVIVSDNVELASSIREANAGMVIPCDIQHVAGAVVRVLGDVDLRTQLGKTAKHFVAKRFSWDVLAAQQIGIYRQMVASNGEGPGRPGPAPEYQQASNKPR